jgi:hypothetical protein
VSVASSLGAAALVSSSTASASATAARIARASERDTTPFTRRPSSDSKRITLRSVRGPNWPSAVVS